MEQKLQTKVTDFNRENFYKQVYDHQTCDSTSLVNLSQLGSEKKLLIDCCGWHYKNCFPSESIIALENINTVLEYRLTKNQFDKMFDGRNNNIPTWPRLNIKDAIIVFDRSPLLKYQNLENIKKILNSVCLAYHPKLIVMKQNLLFVDDPRLVDRFYNVSKLSVDGCVVKKFNYDLDSFLLEIHFQKKQC